MNKFICFLLLLAPLFIQAQSESFTLEDGISFDARSEQNDLDTRLTENGAKIIATFANTIVKDDARFSQLRNISHSLFQMEKYDFYGDETLRLQAGDQQGAYDLAQYKNALKDIPTELMITGVRKKSIVNGMIIAEFFLGMNDDADETLSITLEFRNGQEGHIIALGAL